MKHLLAPLCALLIASPVWGQPGPPPVVQNHRNDYSGKTLTFGGDSRAQQGDTANPPGSTYSGASYFDGWAANSLLGYLTTITQNSFNVSQSTYGYPGSPGGLRNIWPITQGSCSANSTIVFSVSAPTGTPANTAGNISISFDAGGHATVGQYIAESTPGSGYISAPTLTVSSGGSCSQIPTFAYVLTGVGNFGVPGDKTAGYLQRVQTDICSNPPDVLINEIGVNDIIAGTAESTITANLLAINNAELACGITPVWLEIYGVGSSLGSWTTTKEMERIRVNRYLQTLSQTTRASGSIYGRVYFVDTSHLTEDPTSSSGDPIANCLFDKLHQGPICGFYVALAAANVLQDLYSVNQYQPSDQQDIYDVTNNPAGNLLGTTGLMLGTGGTVNSPCTGSIATGYSVTSSSITGGTFLCVGSLETTRTDGRPGRRTVLTLSDIGGGNSETVTFDTTNSITSNVTLGTDVLQGYVNIDVSNLSNVIFVGCDLLENASGTSQQSTQLYAGNASNTAPMVNSSALTNLPDAKILPDFGSTGSGSYRIPCLTQPLNTQATATSYIMRVRVQGFGTWSATLKVSDEAIRKTNVP